MADPMDVLKQLDSEYGESKNKLIMQYLADQEVETERTLEKRNMQDPGDKVKLKGRLQMSNSLNFSDRTIELHEEKVDESNKEGHHLPELSPTNNVNHRSSLHNTPVNLHDSMNSGDGRANNKLVHQSNSCQDFQQSTFSHDQDNVGYQFRPTSLSFDRRLSTEGVQLSLHESLAQKRSSLSSASNGISDGHHDSNPALEYFQPTGYRQREITTPNGSSPNSPSLNRSSLIRRPYSVYHLPPINHDDSASNGNHQKTVDISNDIH